ncbi:N-acetylglucosamine-6-phosphate deacetylase [Candidatus Blochmannia ocreatus (nom. nud.)]|uniref:N-acetylglucosamine-6-phosphate deacetylase n=1 Tax=Candidatus Blochmannia ocreatus (nom. nud.) TaxID=251538 RepID=A0ABY4SWD6_9ENTR|nr:N-acetylglucosamine-6-phosphate deacetylase [Candidatus Blochmannia ocreatus]URJ25378.1 N-acetylglucosamine-6-phosphate deacetylase [Candidatus Blochmannia ocreatus]
MYALVNGKIYTGKELLTEHALIISNDIIKDICIISKLPGYINIFDVSDLILSPGFIDLQINGCGGVQFSDNLDAVSEYTLYNMMKTNQRFGCISFLPTLITSSEIVMNHAIEVVRGFMSRNKNQILGLHLEGPFINPIKKGIHDAVFIRVPNKKMIHYLCDNSDVVKKITLAPEMLDMVLIRELKDAGICVAIGHSNATYAQAKCSFSYGITFGTHLFNAMPSIFPRDPGIVGAILDTSDIYCSIIADGLHVHWANIRYAKEIKRDHIILVTDAIGPAGSRNVITKFYFSNKIIHHSNGVCIDNAGVLSGSTLMMIQAIKNMVQYANIPLDEALRMATLYPAKSIGIDGYLGSIEINKIANLTIFDENYRIKKIVVNGMVLDV